MLSITFTLALGKIDESQPGGSNTDAASALFVLIITCLCVFAICIVVVALLQLYEKLMRRSNALKHWQTVRRSEGAKELLRLLAVVRSGDVQHFSEEDGQHEGNEHNDRSKVADNGAGSGMEMQVISTSTAARKSDGNEAVVVEMAPSFAPAGGAGGDLSATDSSDEENYDASGLTKNSSMMLALADSYLLQAEMHGAGSQVPTENETVDDGSDLPTLPNKPVWEEHEVLPDFDAPELQAMERV